MKRSNKNISAGFTLFELVVSLTLLIILLVTLSTIFTAGLGIYKHHDKGLSPFKEARNIFSVIERDIASLIPSTFGGTNSELFQGSSDRVRFITISPETYDTIGVRYLYNSGTNELERHSTDTDSSTLPINFNNVDTVGEHVNSFTITYYSGHHSGLHLTSSSNSWPSIAPVDVSVSEMPKAVSITLTIADPLYPDIQEEFTRLFIVENR